MNILVAGVGNIFLGDDAFGSEVARMAAARPWPEGVRVIDYGIRALDLIYALLDGPDAVILIDVVQRGQAPGTLYLIEPEIEDSAEQDIVNAHSMNPVQVLRTARSMGANFGRVLLIGCEPAELGSDEDGRMGLSEQVAGAMDEAVRMLESAVGELMKQAVQTGRVT